MLVLWRVSFGRLDRGLKVGSVVSEFVVSRRTYKKDVVGIFTYKKNIHINHM